MPDDVAEGLVLADRVAAREAAVLEFGRFALRSPGIERSVARAVEVIADVLGAPMVALLELLGPGRVAVVGAHGTHAHARLGESVRRPDPVEIEAPGLAVPVPVGGRPWGRLVVADDATRRFEPADRAFLQSIADVLAAALDRERVDSGRAAVAALGRYALGCPDVALTTQRAVDVVTRALEAPMGAVLRYGDRPHTMRLVQAFGPVPLERGEEFDLPAGLERACAGDGPLVVEDWVEAVETWRDAGTWLDVPWWAEPPGRVGRPPARTPVVASVAVPVRRQGRAWGRLVIADSRPRRFTTAEVELVAAVADVLAAALERDRFEAGMHRPSAELQHALRPPVLPCVPGVELAARSAAPAEERMGGDWYDVLELSQGRIGLVTGTVPGHDAVAAALVSQVRDLIRAFAGEGHPPAEVLARADRFVVRRPDQPVTCCYAELEPRRRALVWAAAGHPPPVVVAPGGGARALPGTPGPALGAAPEVARTETTVLLPAGAVVLLAPDGVATESAGPHDPIPVTVTRLARDDVQDLAEALACRTPGAIARRDDAALLVVRLAAADLPDALGDGGADRVFRPASESTAAARRFVRDVLAGWGLPQLEQPAALAVSELVTNTLLHTTSPIQVSLRRTGPLALWIGVYDDSDRFVQRRRPAADDPSGRGLVVVETLADSWGVTPGPDGGGKTVWLELTAAPEPA